MLVAMHIAEADFDAYGLELLALVSMVLLAAEQERHQDTRRPDDGEQADPRACDVTAGLHGDEGQQRRETR